VRTNGGTRRRRRPWLYQQAPLLLVVALVFGGGTLASLLAGAWVQALVWAAVMVASAVALWVSRIE
jgi:hypothetical protein